MVGIVFCNDLNTCPYIDKYLSVLEKCGTEYEIIIWNRRGDGREFPANYRVYNEASDIHTARWKKLGAFVRFRKFLNRTIKERKYDKLIMLTTLPAVLCSGLLLKEYKGKYIFDFRDLSYERFGFYKNKVKRIIENSSFTCISSPSFAEALDNPEYVMAHNFRYSDLDNINENMNEIGDRINLLHIGITRGEEYNRRLADIFGKDDRFTVNIVGSGNDTESFLEYTKELDSINVVGTYNNETKAGYISDATMLLYYYPCDFNCNRALANKYYDGIIYKKPLIGNINTYSGCCLQEKGLGISLDIDDPKFADKVYEYVKGINKAEYVAAANAELASILDEDKKYLAAIEDFLKE